MTTIAKCYMPDCGEDCHAAKWFVGWRVECDYCAYRTGTFDTEAEAVAAHNRLTAAEADVRRLDWVLTNCYELHDDTFCDALRTRADIDAAMEEEK